MNNFDFNYVYSVCICLCILLVLISITYFFKCIKFLMESYDDACEEKKEQEFCRDKLSNSISDLERRCESHFYFLRDCERDIQLITKRVDELSKDDSKKKVVKK